MALQGTISALSVLVESFYICKVREPPRDLKCDWTATEARANIWPIKNLIPQ